MEKECQELEDTLADMQFKNNLTNQEAIELRESIKLTDETYKEMLQQRAHSDTETRESYDLSASKLQAMIDKQTLQIEQMTIDNQEIVLKLEEKTNENKQLNAKLLSLQVESSEFESEFKKWEKQFEADQKVKIAKIDKLQCELEKLQEILQAKEEEIANFKDLKERVSFSAHEPDTSPLLFENQSSAQIEIQEYAQNEQISHEDFLNQTQDFLEVQEFERNGNFQDFIEEEENTEFLTRGQRVLTPETTSTMTRFASFVGEQRLLTEADLTQELFVTSQTSSETKRSNETDVVSQSADHSVQEIRRDPEEEYFRLSVLSLKMQYNERDIDYVFQISSSKLYRRCKKESIPFHQWYNWIEYQLILIDQADNPTSAKHQQPTTRKNKMIEQDRKLSTNLLKQKVHQEEQSQVQQRAPRETFFQRMKRTYFR